MVDQADSSRRLRVWVRGAGPKSRAALDELGRTIGLAPGQTRVTLVDLAVSAVERLQQRRPGYSFGPQQDLLHFGAPNLASMAGGLVTRAREHGGLFEAVVFEDHGLGPGAPEAPTMRETFLFFGSDGLTLHGLPRHRHSFETMRQALAPDARVVLMQCWAFSDGGQLALALSEILGCPVLGMNGAQIVDNQQMEGAVFRAYEGRVDCVGMAPWVVYFD